MHQGVPRRNALRYSTDRLSHCSSLQRKEKQFLFKFLFYFYFFFLFHLSIYFLCFYFIVLFFYLFVYFLYIFSLKFSFYLLFSIYLSILFINIYTCIYIHTYIYQKPKSLSHSGSASLQVLKYYPFIPNSLADRRDVYKEFSLEIWLC